MDVRFNLLIVDDDIRDEEDSTYKKIKNKIESMNLIPKIKLSNGSDYKKIVKSDNFDLYLIDFSLVNDIQGHQVIKEIRDNNKNLTDIILYSTTNENLYNKVSELNLDGVYVCQRKDLFLKTEKILNKLEKRTLNPLSLRGIVLHNCSDIEFSIREVLLRIYRQQKAENKELIEKEVNDLIKSGIDNFEQKTQECRESGDFFENLLLAKNYLFDMGKKIMLLRFLKKKQLINLTNKDINLLQSLNEIRNNLGHSKILIKDGEMISLNIKAEETKFEEQECKKIKEKIIRAFDIINILED